MVGFLLTCRKRKCSGSADAAQITMSDKSVYIAQAGDAIKVGISNNPKQRIKQLNTANPSNVELVEVLEQSAHYPYSAREFEEKIHALLEQHHRSGEWFDGEALLDITKYIAGADYGVKLTDRQRTVLRVIEYTLDKTPPCVYELDGYNGDVVDLWPIHNLMRELLSVYQIPLTLCVGCGEIVNTQHSECGEKCPRCETINE